MNYFFRQSPQYVGILFRNQFDLHQLTILWIQYLDFISVDLEQFGFQLFDLLEVSVDQHNVWRQDLFNIISCVDEICVSLETDIVNSHLAQNAFLLIDLNELVWIHDLFGESSFTAITCKYDTISCIIGPFEKQFPT